MEKIKKLLAEYEIRFHDTEEIIITENIPFSMVNSGTFEPKVASNIIWNKNGIAYKDGKWSTAKIIKKPEKWVVEKDENHPMWLRFKEMTKWTDSDCDTYLYYSDGRCSTTLLDFRGYQYLTLDQWAEFFLPKVDFSIHNDYEFFFVRTNIGSRWLSRGKLTEGDCTSFCLDNYKIYTINKLIGSKNYIIEFRRPTEEEFNILYNKHPEYALAGEKELYGLFWNESAPDNKVVRRLKSVTKGSTYDAADKEGWDCFYKFSPELQKQLCEEIHEIENKIK